MRLIVFACPALTFAIFSASCTGPRPEFGQSAPTGVEDAGLSASGSKTDSGTHTDATAGDQSHSTQQSETADGTSETTADTSTDDATSGVSTTEASSTEDTTRSTDTSTDGGTDEERVLSEAGPGSCGNGDGHCVDAGSACGDEGLAACCDANDDTCPGCVVNADCLGENSVCSPAGDCVCSGCQIGAACFAAGALNPENSCQVCSPFVSDGAFSPNVGASCGDAAQSCSAQDSCNNEGVCLPNHLAPGEACSGGECDGAGVCAPFMNPFDCANGDPPPTVLAYSLLEKIAGAPPAAAGGLLVEGRYAPTRIDVYGSDDAPAFIVKEMTFEFSQGFVQIGFQTFVGTGAVGGGERLFIGSMSTAGTSISFDVDVCDSSACEEPNDERCAMPSSLSYTATATSLVTILAADDGSTVVTTYARQ